jgi:hypothetical protein
MNLLKEIEEEHYSFQIYQYNGKYILKFAKDGMEQSFKIGETDVFGVEDFEKMITPELIQNMLTRFEKMKLEWDEILIENKKTK